MSDTKKNFLGIVSIFVLAFCYWYYFTPQGKTWRVNQQITKEWNNQQIVWKKGWEASSEKEDALPEIVVAEVPKQLDDSRKKVTQRSSSRNPIRLTNRRNYITGDNVTYIVPSKMRRLRLKIQDRVGRNISSYNLPNSIISIKANQRITIEVE